MKYEEYQDAGGFLGVMEPVFLSGEAVYGLMYGICLRLEQDFLAWGRKPLLAIVHGGDVLLAAVMTPPYKLQLCSPAGTEAASVRLLAEKLRAEGWEFPGLLGERGLCESFAREWQTLTGARWSLGMLQRIHRLDRVSSVKMTTGHIREAGPEDAELVEKWASLFHRACFGNDDCERAVSSARAKLDTGGLYLWCDPEPVSMAMRSRPTRNGESIGFVYTPPESRGMGYATSVVASLSSIMLQEGRKFCTLYTDLANPTSNSIYRKIGYRPVADVVDIGFDRRD